ncbi:MAG: toxin-antitoxin system YwqK family antitoxin, partial [Bacteroidales bacterium]
MNTFRFTIIFMLAVVFLPMQAQISDTAINRTDAQGLKQGLWKKTDDQGNIIYEGRFRDDVPYGTFTYYYPDGIVKAVSQISDEGRRAFIKTYRESGQLMAEGFYLDKEKDSTWNFYHPVGFLLTREKYENGKKSGPSVSYYPEGDTSEILHYKSGLK